MVANVVLWYWLYMIWTSCRWQILQRKVFHQLFAICKCLHNAAGRATQVLEELRLEYAFVSRSSDRVFERFDWSRCVAGFFNFFNTQLVSMRFVPTTLQIVVRLRSYLHLTKCICSFHRDQKARWINEQSDRVTEDLRRLLACGLKCILTQKAAGGFQSAVRAS